MASSSPQDILAAQIEKTLETYRPLLTAAQLETFRELLTREVGAHPTVQELVRAAQNPVVDQSGGIKVDEQGRPIPKPEKKVRERKRGKP